jgi:hypothetical protein
VGVFLAQRSVQHLVSFHSRKQFKFMLSETYVILVHKH